MPFSGYDPAQHGDAGFPDDIATYDPSAYYALSPGGRFPGDIWSYLEGAAASDPASGRRDPYGANPDYDVPGYLEHLPGGLGRIISAFMRQHEASVRRGGGDASSINNPLEAGDPYQMWSGPGAPYGPEGGPLHGLLDMGNDHLNDYDYGMGTGDTPPGSAGGGRGHGGGGQHFGPLNFQPYQGIQHQASFVDWQPKQPFSVDNSPTHFVPGGGLPAATTTAPSAAAPATTTLPPRGVPAVPAPGGAGGGGRRGGHGGGGVVATKPSGGGTGGAGGNLSSDMLDSLPPELAAILSRLFPGAIPSGTLPTERHSPRYRAVNPGRGSGERGYDTNYLGRGTPGWMRDHTTGILNTAGMPNATPPSRSRFGSDDDYITALHDLGFDSESIIGAMNGWGTGGVVRGDDGYMFANDSRAQEGLTPGQFGLFGNTPSSYGGMRGSAAGGFGTGGGGGAQPNAADSLISGWNPYLR